MWNNFNVYNLLLMLLWILPDQYTLCEESQRLSDGSNSDIEGWRIPTATSTGSDAIVPNGSHYAEIESLPDSQALHGDDPNNDEPSRKRRRPGRKRKRRPQSGQQGNNLESQTEWQPDQTETYTDNQYMQNLNTESVVNPSGGIFAHADVQSQVVRVQGVKDFRGRGRARETIQGTVAETERTVTESTSFRTTNKSYRRPYSLAKKEEEEQKQTAKEPSSNRAADLKNLLKQSGGLSLSEILQQQNLSLDDLLKGKQKAIKALQNTAAPPQHAEAWEATPTKTTRRIPAPSRQPHTTVKEAPELPIRRNLTNRISNYQRPQQQSTQPAPVHELHESVEQPMPIFVSPRTASTIPTYTTNAGVEVATISNNLDASGVRRLPTHRLKPIKEVVSAIRPDLTNSASRKRMPTLKSSLNKTTIAPSSTQQKEQPVFKALPKPKERPRYSPGANLSLRLNGLNNGKSELSNSTTEAPSNAIRQDTSTAMPTVLSSTSTTTVASSTSAVSLENARLNIRNRLAMRPRLRPPIHMIGSTIPIPSSSEQPNVSTYRIDMIDITTPAPPSARTSQIPNDNAPEYNLHKKLNESKPELNVIEVELDPYQDTKTKGTATLNDLFDPIAHQGNETNDEELIHSSTSRSYQFTGSNDNGILRFPSKHSDSTETRPFKNPYLDVTERNPSLFTDINTRVFDDKTELLDLLEDRRSGSRLVKVLQQRNMTLDQLIEHRKRGSSQLHLAEIFWNRTGSDEPEESHNDNLDIVTAFENFPKFNLDNIKSIKPDEIKTDSQGSSYFTSIINIKPTDEIFKEGRSVREPPMMINLASAMVNGKVKNVGNTPWPSATDYDSEQEQIAENVDHNFLDRPSSKVTVISPRRSPPPESFQDIDLLESEAARSHDPLDLELSGHGFRRNSMSIENTELPLGVRSAIIASASIVGVSLGIFIVIFLTFRWQQKRRKKVSYSDRFQAVRGRLPILNSRDASPSKRGSSPPMFLYGSRRSSKLNTMDPNSPEVQEYLYEAMRKPFQ